MRLRWDPKTGQWFEVDKRPRGEAAAVIHSDEMPPTEHPATGEIFTSKKAFNAATLASGHVPCGGCDHDSSPKRRSINLEARDQVLYDAIQESYRKLEWDEIPKPEPTPKHVMELWRKIEREHS